MSDTKLPSIRVETQDINNTRSTVRIIQDKGFYSDAASRLKPYKALPKKLKPAMEGIADYYRRVMIPRVFQREGPGWVPLARRTQKERELMGYNPQHPILKRTGDLLQELTQKSHPAHVEVITVGKNARIEIGGSSEKFVQNQMGDRGMNLPTRKMIPGTGSINIESGDRMEIQRIIDRTIKENLRR